MTNKDDSGKVTGIGGVFFLANKDNKSLAKWYEQHLGISIQEWGGGVLEWRDDHAEDGGSTVWNIAASDSDWFAPSQARFMINYRVDNLDALMKKLLAANVEIINGPEYHENGAFAWIMDPEGNKVELWEPKLWDEKNKQ